MYRIKQDLRGEQMCLDENGRQDGSSRKSQKEWEKYSLKKIKKKLSVISAEADFLGKCFKCQKCTSDAMNDGGNDAREEI